jgi:hypothetical protein
MNQNFAPLLEVVADSIGGAAHKSVMPRQMVFLGKLSGRCLARHILSLMTRRTRPVRYHVPLNF